MLPERCISAPHPTSRRQLSLQPSSEPSCRPHPFHAPPAQPRARPVCAPHHHARQRPPHPTRIRPPSRSRSAPRSLLHPHPVRLLSPLWQLPSLPRARPSLPAAFPHQPPQPRPCAPRPLSEDRSSSPPPFCRSHASAMHLSPESRHALGHRPAAPPQHLRPVRLQDGRPRRNQLQPLRPVTRPPLPCPA